MKKINNDNRQNKNKINVLSQLQNPSKIYKKYRLRDINNFEKNIEPRLTEWIKQIFDSFIKTFLEEKLKEHGINISAEDYNIDLLFAKHYDCKTISLFKFYYNLRFNFIRNSIAFNIGDTHLSESDFNDINNDPDQIFSVLDTIIKSEISSAFIGDLSMMYFLEGDIEKMQELSQENEGLKNFHNIFTNKKGKEWRYDILLPLAQEEYKNNKILNKRQAIKIAFEKIPNKEKYRQEFDIKFDSIYSSLRQKII